MTGVFHNLLWLGEHIVPADQYDQLDQKIWQLFSMILLGIYASRTSILMTKALKKSFDLAKMKNPENLQFSLS